MSNELLDEIVQELRRQNVLLEKLNRRHKESAWYLWLIALILVVEPIPILISLG